MFKWVALRHNFSKGRYKKIYEKVPKTSCQRLLESPDLTEEHKAALPNPVALKWEMDTARDRLLKLAAKRGITGETV